MNTIGIYGGLGGLVGASLAGCNIIAAEEPRTEFTRETFKGNIRYLRNIKFSRLFSHEDLTRIVNQSGGIDITISSPPCKRFSALASKKKDRLKDIDWKEIEMTHVFKRILAINPRLAIIENLPKAAEFITFQFNEIPSFGTSDTGIVYNVPYFVYQIQLQANQFGVPQRRLRHFWILSKQQFNDYIPPFPKDHKVPCGKLLKGVEKLPNMEISKHSAERIAGFAALKIGESYYNTQNNTRIDPDKLGPVVTSHRTAHVHPTEPRTLTVRECARICGYPDDFIFIGPKTKQHDMVGCGIMPNIVKDIIEKYFQI